MNKIQLVALVALGISIIVSIVMRMPGASRSRARKLLAEADWLDDDAADGARVKIRGVVKTRDGERFLSPLTKNRCVVMRLRAAVRHGSNPRSKMADKVQIMPFVIEDDDKVTTLIDATAAELDISGHRSSKWTDAEKRAVLIELGHASANTDKSTFEETLVEVGQLVTIAGTLKKSDGKASLVGDAEHPIAIAIERMRDRDLSAEP